MAKEVELRMVPDLTSPTGFRVVRVEATRSTVHIKSYDEAQKEAFGESGEAGELSAVDALKVMKGLLQDINKAQAEAKKS